MRKAYRQKMEAQIKEWRADIDKLKARAEKANADAKIELNRNLERVKERYDTVRDRFEELQDAGEDRFEALKKSFEAAVDEFKTTWKKTNSDTPLSIGK